MKPSADVIALGFLFTTRTPLLGRVWLTAGASKNPVPILLGAASGSLFKGGARGVDFATPNLFPGARC
jgi:hypothetical protein